MAKVYSYRRGQSLLHPLDDFLVYLVWHLFLDDLIQLFKLAFEFFRGGSLRHARPVRRNLVSQSFDFLFLPARVHSGDLSLDLSYFFLCLLNIGLEFNFGSPFARANSRALLAIQFKLALGGTAFVGDVY